MNQTPEQRTKVLSVRLTPTDWNTLAKRADQCGIAVSTFVRQAALGFAPKPKRRRLEKQAIYQLGRIGNNLNQLTRTANANRRVELSQRLQDVLQQVVAAIGRLA